MSGGPNVLWITLDSVRFDHTSLAGYERDTTPNLRNIAESSDGLSFDGCISHGIRTATSVPSILTGVPPSRHGVGISNESLPTEITTVAERFSELGYRTAALSENAHVSKGTGVDRGFDQVTWVARQNRFKDVPLRSIAKWGLAFPRHWGGPTLEGSYHNTAFMTTDILKRWLREFATEEPFFIYAHYNGPHWPYTPPKRYLNAFTDDLEVSGQEARDISYQYAGAEHLRPIAEGLDISSTEREAIRAMYDAELAFTDECVGTVYDKVQSLNLEDTIVILTSDHGELLGEHGLIGHLLYPYEELLQVPLVLQGVSDSWHQNTVQHTDVMRTILEASGGDTEGIRGIDLRTESREYTLSQGGGSGVEKPLRYLHKYNPEFDSSRYSTETYTALRTGDYKLVHTTERDALYEIPDDETDLAERHPEKLAELRDLATTELNEIGERVTGEEGAMTDQMEQQLRDLGYVVD